MPQRRDEVEASGKTPCAGGFIWNVIKDFRPLQVSQGYAFVADSRGRAVKTTVGIKPGDRMEISVTDGVIEVEVTGIRKETWET